MPSATTPTTWAPHREGWYLQRDTTSYAYSADGSFEHPRPADAERLAGGVFERHRHRWVTGDHNALHHHGTDPVTSPTAKTYVLPFDLKQTTTVKFYSVDQAAHAEPVRSWLVRIDAAPPAVSITSPASGSRYPPGAKITIAAAAADKGTGSGRPSGVTGVRFYLDGRTQLAALTTRPYSFTWKPTKGSKGKHQLTAVATDRAGIPPPPPSPCT